MINQCTKHISMWHVSHFKLVLWITLFQCINTLVCTKDIVCASACQNVSIMNPGINVQRSVTPMSLMFDVLWYNKSRQLIVHVFMSFMDISPLFSPNTFVHHLYAYSHIYLTQLIKIKFKNHFFPILLAKCHFTSCMINLYEMKWIYIFIFTYGIW